MDEDTIRDLTAQQTLEIFKKEFRRQVDSNIQSANSKLAAFRKYRRTKHLSEAARLYVIADMIEPIAAKFTPAHLLKLKKEQEEEISQGDPDNQDPLDELKTP